MLSVVSFEAIPNTEHIHYAERAVIEPIARTNVSCRFAPEVSSVVGTDISLKATVVVCLEYFENACVAVTVAVAGFGEISVFKMLDVADMCKGDAVAMLADDVCHVGIGIGVETAGAKGEAVVFVIHHL